MKKENKILKKYKIKPRTKAEIKEGMVRYRPTKTKGLTVSQVDERMRSGLVNRALHKKQKTVFSIICKNLFTFFNLLCAFVAASLIYVGSYADLTFLVVVLLNTIIGIVQEVRAKNMIEKLTLSSATYATVIRDGQRVSVLKEDIVLDDIIVLSTGMQISTDCMVIDGMVEVNEALLTGESLPVKHGKKEMLLAGSFVSSGECYAKAENIGRENYIERLSSRAKKYTKPKSELLQSMNIIIRVIAVIILPLACLTAMNNFNYFDGDIYSTVTKTAGSIIGMIPAGLFLLTSMALAVGVIRLSKRRTLVQELYCIEMLARANVLCLDKTGTLTDGSMKVALVENIGDNDGGLKIADIIPAIIQSSTMNSTAQALKGHFSKANKYKISSSMPFSSERKYSGVEISGKGVYKMGAAEYILPKVPVSLQRRVDELSHKGYRVLIVTHGGSLDKMGGTPISLIAIEDNIRKDAPQTIEWFKNNNVDIKIISGDNAMTVSEIARRCGVNNSDKYISLQNLSKEEVIRAAQNYTVFGRVSPEQKAILIKALKNKGKTVAMTGDGVNDILALKEADCSIAIAAGSEAARSVSHLVLLDSDFSSMPSVVSEGRRVVNNITKSSSLFLMKTIFVMSIAIFTLALQVNYPFSPIQFFLLETFIVGVPSFLLALQPNNNAIEGKFITNVFRSALPSGLVMAMIVMAIYVYQHFTGCSIDALVTMGSISITLFGVLVLYKFCMPFNMYKICVFVIGMLLVLLSLLFIPWTIFGYIVLSLEQTLFCIVAIIIGYYIFGWIHAGIKKALQRSRTSKV